MAVGANHPKGYSPLWHREHDAQINPVAYAVASQSGVYMGSMFRPTSTYMERSSHYSGAGPGSAGYRPPYSRKDSGYVCSGCGYH